MAIKKNRGNNEPHGNPDKSKVLLDFCDTAVAADLSDLINSRTWGYRFECDTHVVAALNPLVATAEALDVLRPYATAHSAFCYEGDGPTIQYEKSKLYAESYEAWVHKIKQHASLFIEKGEQRLTFYVL